MWHLVYRFSTYSHVFHRVVRSETNVNINHVDIGKIINNNKTNNKYKGIIQIILFSQSV